VFSASKGVVALLAHLLVERGQLDLDAPVAQYWPDFAGGGKQDLKARWLLTHQAGLPSLDPDFSLDDLRELAPVLRAIEAQRPRWEPGTQFTYHAITFGLLVGELLRRVSGRPLADLVRSEIVEPLQLDAWLGLPEGLEIDLARLELAASEHPAASPLSALPPEFLKVLTLGSALPPMLVTGSPGDFNDRALLALPLGASNLVTDARSLARLYAAAVSEVDGFRLINDTTAAACTPLQTSDTPIFGLPPELASAPHTQDFGLGFIAGEMLGPTSFGHHGASGAWGFADLDARIGFGYVPNRMHSGENVRAAALIQAVRKSL
jgi:CubicO group peptidase (beta-lactamase class C family)